MTDKLALLADNLRWIADTYSISIPEVVKEKLRERADDFDREFAALEAKLSHAKVNEQGFVDSTVEDMKRIGVLEARLSKMEEVILSNAKENLRLLSEIDSFEAKLSKMEEALGDGGDLEYCADLLQTATNDHGVDQSFDNNPYSMSDYLRKLAALAGESDGGS